MNKIALALFTGITFSLLFTPLSSAVDREGCLLCHRYPGLVKYEKAGTAKVLHIDEEKHLLSAHGRTDCRQCHPNTVQIPHTDITEVECNITCHIDDKEKIERAGRSYLRDFHKEERFAITDLDDQTSCRVCHPLYPHSENNKVRAFVNMHTGFMYCEVCHVRSNNRSYLTYEWSSPEAVTFTGEPYGSHQKIPAKVQGRTRSLIPSMLKIFDKKTEDSGGRKSDHDHRLSRISLYRIDAVGKKLMTNTQDNQRAVKFLNEQYTLSSADKERELAFFHRDIAKKEISVACNECHSPEGVMDFRKLGFNENRANDLQYMNIKSLVTKYDTFVIPNLFGPKH